MKSLLDPSFNYVPSIRTDLRKTFARIRREQRTSDLNSARAHDGNVVTPLFLMANRAAK
ncbi:MAG: hypothetical protein ABI981_02870 [Betaproteobacteria bacterium]